MKIKQFGKYPFFVVGPFCTPHPVCLCDSAVFGNLRFQSQYFWLKTSTPAFRKRFFFSRKKPFTIFAKYFILVVSQGSEYISIVILPNIYDGVFLWKQLLD